MAAAFLPVLFVVLCLRMITVSVGPLILPLLALAFIALVLWLWLHRMR